MAFFDAKHCIFINTSVSEEPAAIIFLSSSHSCAPKMKEELLSKAKAITCPSKRRPIPEDSNLHSHHLQNLKPQNIVTHYDRTSGLQVNFLSH